MPSDQRKPTPQMMREARRIEAAANRAVRKAVAATPARAPRKVRKAA